MKSNYKNIDDANKKIDSIIKQFEICQEKTQKENEQLKSTQQELINDVRKYSCQALDFKRKIKKLKEERNAYAPNEVFKIKKENKKIKDELKEANADVGIFIEEQKQLKDRISNLVTANTRLQNDLFTEQLKEDETDDYIEKLQSNINYLKNELFQIYINKLD